MSRAERILEKMHNNPRDWRIDDLKTVARACGIEWRQQGTSHVTFRHSSGSKLTVPAQRPIKPVTIRQFIQFVDQSAGD